MKESSKISSAKAIGTFGALGDIVMATGIAMTATSTAANVAMGLIKVDEA